MSTPTSSQSLHDWLMSERPQSRRQAALGRAYGAWRGFARNRLAMLGLAIVLALVWWPILADCAGAVFALHRRPAHTAAAAAVGAHWFGTDDQGRDILSRIIHGSRITLYVVVLVAVLAAPVGLAGRHGGGLCGGWVDAVLMRITDIFLAFPRLILALAFVAALGPGIENAVIAIAITSWPPYARIARAETLTMRQADYIAAVRLIGASPWRIVLRHIMPLCVSSVIVRVTLDMAGIILTAAGLGFLGLGAQPPMPEWGAMIANGRQYVLDQWWVAADPGLAIFLVSLAFNLLGDGPARRARPERCEMSPRGGARSADQPCWSSRTCAWPFPGRDGGWTEAVRGVSFTLGRERLGIVGESGSGKSQTGRAILGLTAPGRPVTARRLSFDGIDLLRCPRRPAPRLRGGRIAMVLQDPKFALNPVMRIGAQIVETLRATPRGPARGARRRSRRWRRCSIDDPERVFALYPHEVSGGMGQRAMIAMMLIAEPDLLIADEPTSALDVTVQLQVLASWTAWSRERGMGLIFISHDLRLVSSFCDRVLVMYAGRVVEEIAAAGCTRRAPLHARPAQLPAALGAAAAPAAHAGPPAGVGAVRPRRPRRPVGLRVQDLRVVYDGFVAVEVCQL
jgi:peptide/nickel transport system permease protein